MPREQYSAVLAAAGRGHDVESVRAADRLSRLGASYGHWRKQAEHSARLAETARAYPRRNAARTRRTALARVSAGKTHRT